MLQYFKRVIKRSWIFRAYTESLLRKNEMARFLREADDYLEKNSPDSKEDIRKQYVRDLKKYMFTFDEWFLQYSLYNASEDLKKSFISRSAAQKAYRSIIREDWRRLFNDKRVFAENFKAFIHREITEVDKDTPVDTVLSMINQCGEVIVKPVVGSLGVGIFKVKSEDLLIGGVNIR